MGRWQRLCAFWSAAEGSWNVHGGVSILSRGNGRLTPCTNSTMINAMVAFLLDRIELAAVLPPSHAGSPLNPGSGPPKGAVPQQHVMTPDDTVSKRAPLLGLGRSLTVVWALRANRASHQDAVLGLLTEQLPQKGVQVNMWLGQAAQSLDSLLCSGVQLMGRVCA